MFFLHSFSIRESAVLLAMASDHYVAICKPLHYSTVLTGPLITKTGLAAVTRAVTLRTPLPFLLRCFHYCRGPVIAHCYCEHMAVVMLACGDTQLQQHLWHCCGHVYRGIQSAFCYPVFYLHPLGSS